MYVDCKIEHLNKKITNNKLGAPNTNNLYSWTNEWNDNWRNKPHRCGILSGYYILSTPTSWIVSEYHLILSCYR
jgi:hypothetical protein